MPTEATNEVRSRVRFRPGDAVAIVEDQAVCVIRADAGSDMVQALVAALQQIGSVDAALAALVRSGGLDLPAFALVAVDRQAARLVVRGTAVAHVSTRDGHETISAIRVGTWVERVIDDVESIRVAVDPATPDAAGLAYEVDRGLVPVDTVEISTIPSLLASAAVRPFAAPMLGGVEQDSAQPGVGGSTPTVAEDWSEFGFDGGSHSTDEVEPVVADKSVSSVDRDPAEDRADGTAAHPVPATPDPEPLALGMADRPSVPDDRATLVGPFHPMPGVVEVEPVDLLDPAHASDVEDGSDEQAAGDDYDHLFGATRFRTVEQAAVRPAPDAAEEVSVDEERADSGMISGVPGSDAPSDSSPQDEGDHDGYTISLASLRARLAEEPAAAPSGSPPAVHAVSCSEGHLNPTHADRCRVCGARIHDQEHVSVPRPVLGTLAFSDGRTVEINRPLLIGRSPKATRALTGDAPEVVVVASPQKEVSGTHLEIRIEGWQVLAVDLQSTNGTVVTPPGRDPQRLRPHEPTPIVPGTIVNLADEAEFTFEVSP